MYLSQEYNTKNYCTKVVLNHLLTCHCRYNALNLYDICYVTFYPFFTYFLVHMCYVIDGLISTVRNAMKGTVKICFSAVHSGTKLLKYSFETQSCEVFHDF